MKTRRVLCVIFGASLMTSVSVGSAAAQPRADFAVQVSLGRSGDSAGAGAGIGGRVLFDLTRSLAIDGELNYAPHDEFEQSSPTTPTGGYHLTYHRTRADGFIGPRVGHRFDRIGLFGRVRPGMRQLSDQGLDCGGGVCAFALFVRPVYHNEFVLDLGGTIEFYPTRRTVARFDLGDAMVHHRSVAPPCAACTSHNFTSRVGVGFRF